MPNPFYLKPLPLDAPFCDRAREMKELQRFAESKNNVVIHSPRRFGKTSLVLRVQKNLARRGAVAIYADFFGVGSVDEAAGRLAAAVFKVTRKREPLWKAAVRVMRSFRPVLRPASDGSFEITAEPSAGRTGLSLLEETMDGLGEFIEVSGRTVHTVLDEFQEIVALPEALKVEAALRTRIQHHPAGYFFVGSRRRLLLGIFNERQRPFFQSAFDYPLKPLPEEELAAFIEGQFESHRVRCPAANAREIAALVGGHPYYSQKLSHLVFELAGGRVSSPVVREAFHDLVASERTVFEAIFQGLPPQQRLFLRALAKEPTNHPFSVGYLRKHGLGSLKAIQHALKQLELLDLIERETEGPWKVVDPVFARWLAA